MTFVQATFVLATFVHIRNISAATDPILTKLKMDDSGTIFKRCQRGTYVHATFVLATFDHIRNISAVTDLIFTKLFGHNYLDY